MTATAVVAVVAWLLWLDQPSKEALLQAQQNEAEARRRTLQADTAAAFADCAQDREPAVREACLAMAATLARVNRAPAAR